MPGRRIPPRSFLDAMGLPRLVAADSFYGRMGAVGDGLYPVNDLAAMNYADSGRPSPPPSLVKGILMLQFYDEVSDGEAVERAKVGLRREVGLDLSLGFPGFHPASRTKYRNGLNGFVHCQTAFLSAAATP